MYRKQEQAIHFVFKAFQHKKRIKEDIDMAFHSISVGFILKDLNCSEETILTGLLHDVIEDTDFTYQDLEKNFGKDIADNVLLLSENMNISNWIERKKEFIKRFETFSSELVLVELADKLHNLLSDYPLFLKNGRDSLITTKQNSYETKKWYYKELQKIFNERLKDNALLFRYNELINVYFND